MESMIWGVVTAWVGWLLYRRSLAGVNERAAARTLAQTILDRLSASDDLIAFVRTPEGRALIQGPRTAPAPSPQVSVIRFVQAGVIAVGGGIALLFNAARLEGTTDINLLNEQRLIHYWASAGLAVGASLLIAAAVSYVLARRWDLMK